MIPRAKRKLVGRMIIPPIGTDVEYNELVDLAGLLAMTEDAAETNDEAVYCTFDLDSSIRSDVDHITETFGLDFTPRQG